MTDPPAIVELAHRRGYELVRFHTERFLHYIEGLAEKDLDLPIPGLRWRVGEVVTHVRSVYERYTVNRYRGATPAGVTDLNAEDVARLGVDLPESIASIRSQVGAMARAVEAISPDRLLPFHAGQQLTLAGGWGNLLGELLAHGDDLARATGAPFGVPGVDLEIMWRLTTQVLQGWLRPEASNLDESWELCFPFGGIWLRLDHGRVYIDPYRVVAARHHRLEIDDVETFTLAFPYRRRVFHDPCAALLASRFYDL